MNLFTVAKKCYQCGLEWQGPAFTEQPKDRPPLPGCCRSCNDAIEARIKARAVRPGPIEPPTLNLKRPTREPEIDEDRRYGD